jgi:hypothetical protein
MKKIILSPTQPSGILKEFEQVKAVEEINYLYVMLYAYSYN